MTETRDADHRDADDLDVDYLQDGADERFRHLDIAFFNEVGFNRYRGDLAQQHRQQPAVKGAFPARSLK